jgi:hypothetical protein
LHGSLSPLHDPEVEQPLLVCQASNHHNIHLCDDDVTYERMRAVDSDDDCVVPPPSPRTIEIMRGFSQVVTPLCHIFVTLAQSSCGRRGIGRRHSEAEIEHYNLEGACFQGY